MDQRTFGEFAGVTYQTVSDWENEHSKPPRSRLRALAERLGLTMELFAEGGPLPSDVVWAPVWERIRRAASAEAAKVSGVVERYDPGTARHTAQTSVRLQVAAQLEARVYSAGEAVSRETALSLIREMSDAWARWEATQSDEGEQGGSQQAG